jgi:hypothetical protein
MGVVARTTRENDYQAEQAIAAMAVRLGVKIRIIYPANDAVNQTQQLIKIIQDPAHPAPAPFSWSPSAPECLRSRKRPSEPGLAGGPSTAILTTPPICAAVVRLLCFRSAPTRRRSAESRANRWVLSFRMATFSTSKAPSTAQRLNSTKGMLSTKPAGVELKMLKGDRTKAHGAPGREVMAIAGFLEAASNSRDRLPERCYGDGRKKSFRGPD